MLGASSSLKLEFANGVCLNVDGNPARSLMSKSSAKRFGAGPVSAGPVVAGLCDHQATHINEHQNASGACP